MNGAPVATQYTYDFVRRHLPLGAQAILEIGCGAGELAARLVQNGLQVVALDNDAGSVAAAKSLGVDARLASWPLPTERQFDAVLFTRSLHHIAPLGESVAAALRALAPGCAILVEDFRAEGNSRRSGVWFEGLVGALEAAGAFKPDFDLAATLAMTEPDDHELHSSSAIADTLSRHGRLQSDDAAYYFRYLESEFRDESAAVACLKHELSLVEAKVIDALGKRFVLRAH